MRFISFHRPSLLAFCLFAALLAASWLVPVGAADQQAPAPRMAAGQLGGLEYRFIGPPGNRVSAVVGVPGDLNTYYAGGASGGVWKSTNGGVDWFPVADTMTAQAIGSLAIALWHSDPNWHCIYRASIDTVRSPDKAPSAC